MIPNNVEDFLCDKLKEAREENCVTARQEERQNIPLVPTYHCPLPIHIERGENTLGDMKLGNFSMTIKDFTFFTFLKPAFCIGD